jgi:hypothetical protein
MRISSDVRERERLLNRLREAVALKIATWDAVTEITGLIDCEPGRVDEYVSDRALSADNGMDLTSEDLDDLLGIGTPGRVIVVKRSPNRKKPKLVFDDLTAEKHAGLEPRPPEGRRHKTSFRLVEDIRLKFNIKYPDVDDSPDSEHPMTAVGIVLLSSAILGTGDIEKLIRFTGDTREFVSAIAFNMQNNNLWVNGQFEESQYRTWFAPDGTIHDDKEFWETIQIACGTVWQPEADSNVSLDPCKIYWDERQRPTNSLTSKPDCEG